MFLIFFAIPVTSFTPLDINRKNNALEMYPLSPKSRPKIPPVILSTVFLSLILPGVILTFSKLPTSSIMICNLKPKNHPFVVLPVDANTLKTLFLLIRLLLQTASGVESINPIPLT